MEAIQVFDYLFYIDIQSASRSIGLFNESSQCSTWSHSTYFAPQGRDFDSSDLSVDRRLKLRRSSSQLAEFDTILPPRDKTFLHPDSPIKPIKRLDKKVSIPHQPPSVIYCLIGCVASDLGLG
jgi:hypothetical protein